MNRHTALARLLVSLTPVVLAGCSTAPQATQTLPPPTATSTYVPRPTPTATPPPGAEWHLVIISDSWGWGLGQAYARQIQKDLGVKVTVANYALGDLSAGEVLKSFQTSKEAGSRLEGLQEALRHAEVVVVFPSPMESLDAGTYDNLRSCIRSRPPAAAPGRGFEGFVADLKAIWLKAVELRAGQPTLLRATDWPNPWAAGWKDAGVFDACSACWAGLSGATRQAATDLGIPFVSRLDAFNGPNRDRDLDKLGYLTSDHIHPNELANALSAELLASLGYEATVVIGK